VYNRLLFGTFERDGQYKAIELVQNVETSRYQWVCEIHTQQFRSEVFVATRVFLQPDKTGLQTVLRLENITFWCFYRDR